jgi:hypothetical protein
MLAGMVARAAAALAFVVVAAGAPAPGADIDPVLRTVLSRDLKFSSSDFTDIARGKIIKHTLDSAAPGEVAAVGATWIRASTATFLDRFRDIVHFKQNDSVLQIGRFSDSPTIDDLASLTVDDADLDARRCHVGDCSVRLPIVDILRFQREINWSARDAKVRAVALFKQMIFEHVHAYWSGEPGRILQYDDEKRPILPATEFAGILANSRYIGDLVPGLPAHLTDFPLSRLAGAEDFLYWSKERFGIEPFITVTHLTITNARSGAIVITSKDVYSSRYFDSSLALTIVSPAPEGGFYLTYTNRSRASALKGAFGGLRKSMVERRVRGSLEQSLQAVKVRLERGR